MKADLSPRKGTRVCHARETTRKAPAHPPNSHAEALIPNVRVFRDRSLWEVIGLDEIKRVEIL